MLRAAVEILPSELKHARNMFTSSLLDSLRSAKQKVRQQDNDVPVHRDSRRSLKPTRKQRGVRHVEASDGYHPPGGDSSHVDRDVPRSSQDNPGRARRGHDYSRMTMQDNARTQLGDTYISQQNIYTNSDKSKLSPEQKEKERKKRKKEKQEQRSTFMAHLGFKHMDSRLATIGAAHADTCRWLLATDEYKRWRDPKFRNSHSGFLWIKGKPGAGKSILMKHALKDIQERHHHDTTILSFFFNARGHELEKGTEGMYRSLLHQLFTKLPDRMPKPLPSQSSDWQTQGWPLPILQDMLRDTLLDFGNGNAVICYVDALDECAEAAIRLAIEYFWELGKSATSKGVSFSVCFASRHYPNITIPRHEAINLDDRSEHRRDIMLYVKKTLRGTYELRKELGQEIISRCSGVFLWAALVVRLVNEKMDHGAKRSQLMNELRAVPDGIDELLRDLVLDHGPILLPTLLWVLFSRETLTVPRLYFAIMASTGRSTDVVWNKREVTEEQMRDFILDSSKGLVGFTTTWGYHYAGVINAQLIHETVREFLLGGGLAILDNTLEGALEAKCHARLGLWCQAYLSLDLDDLLTTPGLDEASTRRYLSAPFQWYALSHVFHHLEIACAGGTFRPAAVQQFPWKAWMSHTKEYHYPSALYVLLRDKCEKLVEGFLQVQLAGSLASSHDSDDLTSQDGMVAMDIHEVDVNIEYDKYVPTALISAIDQGFTGVVELLLSCGANPDLAGPGTDTPLLEAMRGRKYTTFMLLLRRGADPQIPARRGFNALGLAVWQGLEGPTKSLLEHGAKIVDFDRCPGGPATTNLQSERAISELLSNHKARIDGKKSQDSLHVAIIFVNARLVRLLSTIGVDLQAGCWPFRTTLHDLVSLARHNASREDGGHNSIIEVAEALIDAGVDVNAIDALGHTALTQAVALQQSALARLLMKRGADLNIQPHREISEELRLLEDQDTGNDCA